MLKKLFGTFSTKVLSAVINFILVIVTANLLGAEGRGEISLFLVNLAFVGMICQLIGGTGLIYLSSRYNVFQLVLPSYLWNIISCLAVSSLIIGLEQIPAHLGVHLLFLALLNGTTVINTMIITGKEEINRYNFIIFLQGILVFVTAIILFYFSKPARVLDYIYATYLAYIVSFVLSFIFSWKYYAGNVSFKGFWPTFKVLVKTSSTAQFSNIIQFLNYRLSYYFLNQFADIKAIGVYSISIAVAESIGLISNSIALVQYVKIANLNHAEEAAIYTKQMAKLSFVLSFGALFILLLLPAELYQLIFGADFYQVKPLLYTLAIGILILSLEVIVSNYFSGLGQYNVNNYAAAVGLVVTVIGCSLLVPVWGVFGAGIIATLSYASNFAYTLYRFKKLHTFSMAELIPVKADFIFAKTSIINSLGSSKPLSPK